MHSSRLRTTRFNGHLRRGVSAQGVYVCVEGVSARGCTPPWTQRQTPPDPETHPLESEADTPLAIACWMHPVPLLWTEFLTHTCERSQNTVLLASTQAVYKSPHSTVWRAFGCICQSVEPRTADQQVGSLRV